MWIKAVMEDVRVGIGGLTLLLWDLPHMLALAAARTSASSRPKRCVSSTFSVKLVPKTKKNLRYLLLTDSSSQLGDRQSYSSSKGSQLAYSECQFKMPAKTTFTPASRWPN